MDDTTATTFGAGGSVVLAAGLIWKFIQFWNHRHVRSTCCGHTGEIGIDVESPAEAHTGLPPPPRVLPRGEALGLPVTPKPSK